MARSKQKKKRDSATPTAENGVSPHATPTPWFKNPYLVFATTVLLALFAGVLKAPDFFKSLNATPSAIEETRHKFMVWWKDDQLWTGSWSSFPEGVVDMASMHLSDTDIGVGLSAEEGVIYGKIESRNICKIAPLSFGFLFLQGNARGESAELVAYEIVEGEHRNLAALKATRTGDVLTLVQTGGVQGLFPGEIRIGRHPDIDVQPSQDEPGSSENICEPEMRELFKSLPKASDV